MLDLKKVAPLFNVETCVTIQEHNDLHTKAIPTIRFTGLLPAHECTWAEASSVLTRTETTTDFVQKAAVASPCYYPRFKQGATLVPRNLVFVTSAQPDLASGQIAFTTIIQSDPDVNDEAKEPWKGLRLEGHLDDDFLYATLLSKNLVPFGARRLHLVAVPMRVGISKQVTTPPGKAEEESFIPMSLDEMRDTITLARSADDWFERAELLWEQKKKETVKETLAQWFNYQSKLTGQSASPGYLVLYGATGSNISACVIDTHTLPIINGVQPRAFVVDHKTYWYRSSSKNEAHYLAALLNAPCVDGAIKVYQTRGIYVGPRDIHRRPFEVCAIPQFDPGNPEHQWLVALSQAAHAAVATLDLSHGGVVAVRRLTRQAIHTYIEQIDEIAERLLRLTSTSRTLQEVQNEEENDEDHEA